MIALCLCFVLLMLPDIHSEFYIVLPYKSNPVENTVSGTLINNGGIVSEEFCYFIGRNVCQTLQEARR